MSNVAEMSSNRLPQDLIQKHGTALDAWFDERFAKWFNSLLRKPAFPNRFTASPIRPAMLSAG